MNMEERVKCLRSVDLFQHFTNDELRSFAENLQELQISGDEILCREGSPGYEMFILLDGELKVSKDTKFITSIKPVEYIGEMAIIEAKPRSATVQAVSKSTLLKITSAQFQEYFSKQPESLVSMMRTLSQRIRLNTEIIAAELEKANILIHDMKNQMAPFLFLDMLEKKIEDESLLRLIRVMQGGRDNLTEMMAEALHNAKRLNHPRDYKSGSLQELLEEIRESEAKAHPDLKDRQFNFVFKEGLPEVYFCRLEIHRVLVNLILNAAQANLNGEAIEVALDADSANAYILVKDRGEGISEQYRDRVFDSHFTTKENGNGLGLASCRHIVEKLHGGRLSFTSREGGGTVFTCALPLKKMD